MLICIYPSTKAIYYQLKEFQNINFLDPHHNSCVPHDQIMILPKPSYFWHFYHNDATKELLHTRNADLWDSHATVVPATKFLLKQQFCLYSEYIQCITKTMYTALYIIQMFVPVVIIQWQHCLLRVCCYV